MKTHVTISTSGRIVSDDKVLDFAKKLIGSDNIVIGTNVMLNAFRVLRARGEIEELTIMFCNGETRTTDKNGMVENWPSDPVLDAEMILLTELAGWN